MPAVSRFAVNRALRAVRFALALTAVACGESGPTPPTPSGFNLRIETLYLVQSVQTRNGSVPLVADKDAYLRIFAVANAANTLTPPVRVQLLHDGTVEQVITIPATGPSVPTSVDQSSLAKSWNVRIPASRIRPGLQVIAEVDPDNQVPEADEQDNRFPVSGAPLSLQVTALQPLRIRFVPMVQAENGRTGNISAANVDDYLAFTRKIHPVSSIDADFRAPYTVNGLGFDPQGNTWQAAVAELDAVRVAEGSDRFYYGVVNTDYNGGGVVGIAAGIPAGSALGWDRFPDAPITLAHEIGHDWGRYHAPCGGAGGPDPSYPYTLGLIGVYGLDIDTREVKLPSANTDIMGYCNARFWISDYTFTGIFNYRVEHPTARVGVAVPSLLVWGRIDGGVPRLEPAFQVTAPPLLPDDTGPYLLEGLDAAGRVVFSHRFSAKAIPDLPGDRRHFAFALPMSDAQASTIATLRLAAGGRESRVVASVAGAPAESKASVGSPSAASKASFGGASATRPITPARADITREGADRVSVRWDAAAYPLVVVRDGETNAILSLARGGVAHVATRTANVRLEFSNGVRSIPAGAAPGR